MAITEDDLQGLPEKKLHFIVENGDPSGQLVPLAKSILTRKAAAMAPQGPEALPSDLARARNLGQARQEEGLARENYSRAITEPLTVDAPTFSKYTSSPMGKVDPALEEGMGRQAIGTAAALAQGVPSVSSLVEGIAGRPVLSEAVERAPAPWTARGHALVGQYLATRGMLGGGAQTVANAVAKPWSAPYSTILNTARKVMPNSNVLPHAMAGVGSTGLVAGGEAALRRGAEAVAGNDVEQLHPIGELALPMLVGGVMSLAPGIAGWVRNKKTTGGRMASDLEEGAGHPLIEGEPTPPLKTPEMRELPSGPTGIEEAEKLGRKKVEQASVDLQRDFGKEHQAARDRWMGTVDPKTKVRIEGEYGKRLNSLMAGGETTDPTDAIAAIDDIIAEKASQSAVKPTGDQLELGQRLTGLRDKLAGYLGPGATLRDYKNAIDEVTALAEQSRSSDVVSNAYKRVESALRADAEAKFQGFGELSAQHREFQTNQERAASILRGKSENELGQGDPLEATAENRIRGNFRRLGKGGPAAEADAVDLEAAAPYTKPMVERARLTQSEADSILRAKKAQEGSRFPLDYKTLGGAASAMLPLAYWHHSPLAMGAMVGASGLYLGHHMLPFARGQAARLLPPTAALEATIPNLMNAAEQFSAARERIGKTSGDLVARAREQSMKLKLPFTQETP